MHYVPDSNSENYYTPYVGGFLHYSSPNGDCHLRTCSIDLEQTKLEHAPQRFGNIRLWGSHNFLGGM